MVNQYKCGLESCAKNGRYWVSVPVDQDGFLYDAQIKVCKQHRDQIRMGSNEIEKDLLQFKQEHVLLHRIVKYFASRGKDIEVGFKRNPDGSKGLVFQGDVTEQEIYEMAAVFEREDGA